jgi:hypothetical protein
MRTPYELGGVSDVPIVQVVQTVSDVSTTATSESFLPRARGGGFRRGLIGLNVWNDWNYVIEGVADELNNNTAGSG